MNNSVQSVGCSSCRNNRYRGGPYGRYPYPNQVQTVNVPIQQNARRVTNTQDVVVVMVKEDIGPCCTDNWAFYGPNYRPPQPSCCQFNNCNRYCNK